MVRAAVIQLVSGADVDANLADAERLLAAAARDGAKLAALPEFFEPPVPADTGADLQTRLLHLTGREVWGAGVDGAWTRRGRESRGRGRRCPDVSVNRVTMRRRPTLVVLGEGGHTTEMLALVDDLASEHELHYVVIDEDGLSAARIRRPGPVHRLPRPRAKDAGRAAAVVGTALVQLRNVRSVALTAATVAVGIALVVLRDGHGVAVLLGLVAGGVLMPLVRRVDAGGGASPVAR